MSISSFKKQSNLSLKQINPDQSSYENNKNSEESNKDRDFLLGHKLTQSTGNLTKNYNNSINLNQPAYNVEEDTVTATLKGSLKIMEKIQRDFESCARNNNMDRNFSSFVFPHGSDSSLQHYVSEYEKQMINTQIEETSDQRIKNYNNLFNIINTSLKDIKDSLLNYSDKKGKIILLSRIGTSN